MTKVKANLRPILVPLLIQRWQQGGKASEAEEVDRC